MSNQLTSALAGVDKAALGGADKAALVLLALGSDRSAALLAGLRPEETARLSEHLSRLEDIDASTRDRVLDEFRRAVAGPPAPTMLDRSLPPASGEEPGNAGPADRAAEHSGGVRALDLGELERVPRRALASVHSEERAAIEVPDDLPVACRAELVSLRLPVSTLGDLGVGDVVLLKPGSDVRVDLVGGQGCRLPGALREIEGRRAVEILSDARTEEEADGPAASDSTTGK